ncbi:hypothetical protein DD581_33820, partial [Klebsiella pneumoniae]
KPFGYVICRIEGLLVEDITYLQRKDFGFVYSPSYFLRMFWTYFWIEFITKGCGDWMEILAAY